MEKGLNNTANRKFFDEIHFIRAFACIGVLLVHVSASYDGFTWITYMFNQLGRFGTPTFALISGFLLFHQVKVKGFNSQVFLKSRFTKIIMPFVVWSVFYLAVNHFGAMKFPSSDQLLRAFVLGDSFYHLYFMVIVIQFYTLFPLLQLLRSKKSWIIALFLSFIATFIFLIPKMTFNIESPIGVIINDPIFILRWIFYFIFGGYLAYFWEDVIKFTKNKAVMASIIMLVFTLAIIEYNTLGPLSSRRLSNLINVPLLTLATIGLFPLITKSKLVYSSLKTIGTFSMGIYLVHPIVLKILKQILPNQFWVFESFPITLLIVLLISIAVVQAIRKLSFVQYIVPVPRMKPQMK